MSDPAEYEPSAHRRDLALAIHRIAMLETCVEHQRRAIDELSRRLNIYADQLQKHAAAPARSCSLCVESCQFCAQTHGAA